MDAPLGAMPLPIVPSINVTSASTVGFPLESKFLFQLLFQSPDNSFSVLLSICEELLPEAVMASSVLPLNTLSSYVFAKESSNDLHKEVSYI